MTQDIQWLQQVMLKYNLRIEPAVYNEQTKRVKVYTRPSLLVIHENQLIPLTLTTWKDKTYIVFGDKMGESFAELEISLEADGLPNVWFHCDFQAPKKITH